MDGRFITVKGIGNVTAKPDLIIITMNLSTITPTYELTMKKATDEIELIRNALLSVGYERQDLKTTDFNIETQYDSYKDKAGNYQRRFSGYKCSHSLKLEFDLNIKQLGETLTAISTCGVSPEFQIAFSIKDKNAISEELLENAIMNAKEKAAILTKAAGVKLSTIQRIDYSWGEIYINSQTKYNDLMLMEAGTSPMEIEPDDIDANDSVTIVWAIE